MVSSGTMLPSPPLPKKIILSTTPLPGCVDAGPRIPPFALVLATGHDCPPSRSPGKKESRGKTASAAVALLRRADGARIHPQCSAHNSGCNPNSNDFCSLAKAWPFPRFCRAAQPWRGSAPHSFGNPSKLPETDAAWECPSIGPTVQRSIGL